MATFNSFAALERQIVKDMQSATNRARDRIEMELIMNVNGYFIAYSCSLLFWQKKTVRMGMVFILELFVMERNIKQL